MPRREGGDVTEFILANTSGGGAGGLVSILFLVVMIGLLYMLMIRPQQRRARQQKELQAAVDVGDEVVTIGGIYGEVTEVDDETVVVEIADGVEVRFVRSAISRKLVFDDESETERSPGPARERVQDQGADETK
jgi:preprotein translocase subunit YajC